MNGKHDIDVMAASAIKVQNLPCVKLGSVSVIIATCHLQAALADVGGTSALTRYTHNP